MIDGSDNVFEMPQGAGRTLKRRGLIAGAAALVTGLIAQQSAQSVGAATNDPLTAGNAFTETSRFILKNTSGTVSAPAQSTTGGDAAIFQATDGSVGVIGYGYGGGNGVYGASDNGSGAVKGVCNPTSASGLSGGYGVFGQVNNANGTGVYGKANVASGFGLFGEANGSGGTGVHGDATNGTGVYGFSGSSAAPISTTPNAGIFGTGTRTGAYGFSTGGTNSVGVLGQCDASGGTGVRGISGAGFPIIGAVNGSGSATNTAAGVLGSGTKGPGVQGQSTGGHGLVGTTDAADGHAGLVGNANNAGGVGLIGIAPGYGTQSVGKAGIFYGDVTVNGTFHATTTLSVASFPDEQLRVLYSMDAPEPWSEDFGEGQLIGGSAEVQIDPHFASIADLSVYHVFLTPYGNTNGLHVTNRGATGFTVAEHNGGENDLTFSYRIVAKRKDVAGERFAEFAQPMSPAPTFLSPECEVTV